MCMHSWDTSPALAREHLFLASSQFEEIALPDLTLQSSAAGDSIGIGHMALCLYMQHPLFCLILDSKHPKTNRCLVFRALARAPLV